MKSGRQKGRAHWHAEIALGKPTRDLSTDLSKQDILAYIRDHSDGVGKRELSRDLAIGAKKRNWLKNQLTDLLSEGMVALNRNGAYIVAQALPRVTVLKVTGTDAGGDALAVPLNWRENREPPLIFINPGRTGRTSPGIGDRVLARLARAEDDTYRADIIRRLEGGPKTILGIFGEDGRIHPVVRGKRFDYEVAPKNTMSADPGELVIAEILPKKRLGLTQSKVLERLGKVEGPHAFSHIAIHMHKIPHHFSVDVLAEAEACGRAPGSGRVDLRDIPLVTIDGADARDFDDAVFAEPWDDPEEKDATEDGVLQGWHLIVAIADVAWYVRPGSELDREARERGNSVYFPDRVIPMLPEALSNGWCSLKPDEDRPCLAAHLWINGAGELQTFKFERSILRSHARLTYEQVQQVRDGEQVALPNSLSPHVINTLFSAYDSLLTARVSRHPLELVTSEPLVTLDETGAVTEMGERTSLESHQLIEEFMIAANIAAALTLEKSRRSFLYRAHEVPPPDKLESFRDFADSLGMKLPKGQVIRPQNFNGLLAQAEKDGTGRMVSDAILRCQSQARYTPEDLGHFGLALRRYSHFTSPIRRYPDLMVHRALIEALALGDDGQADSFEDLVEIGEHFSRTERRAATAERDTVSRFASAYFASRIGDQVSGVINGVAKFGLFVTLKGLGAEGLIPIRELPDDRYHVDEKRRRLIGRRTGLVFQSGEPLDVTVRESNPLSGSLTLALAGMPQQALTTRTNAKRKGSKKRRHRSAHI